MSLGHHSCNRARCISSSPSPGCLSTFHRPKHASHKPDISYSLCPKSDFQGFPSMRVDGEQHRQPPREMVASNCSLSSKSWRRRHNASPEKITTGIAATSVPSTPRKCSLELRCCVIMIFPVQRPCATTEVHGDHNHKHYHTDDAAGSLSDQRPWSNCTTIHSF